MGLKDNPIRYTASLGLKLKASKHGERQNIRKSDAHHSSLKSQRIEGSRFSHLHPNRTDEPLTDL